MVGSCGIIFRSLNNSVGFEVILVIIFGANPINAGCIFCGVDILDLNICPTSSNGKIYTTLEIISDGIAFNTLVILSTGNVSSNLFIYLVGRNCSENCFNLVGGNCA